MSLPAFTAQASLYRTNNRYRSLAFGPASPQSSVIVPQLGGPGFEGLANCLSDCADQHPTWTRARCRAICRDPGGTSPGGTSVGYGPSCNPSPPADCAYLFSGCCVSSGPFGCAFVCPSLHQACLENSRKECQIARHGPLTGGSSYPRSLGPDVNRILAYMVP